MPSSSRALFESAESRAFHVDSFSVPDVFLGELETAMRRNMAFIEAQPGFRGHVVLRKTSGPTTFNIVTIAMWESSEAIERAGVEVSAYYRRIGFDRAATLARWGAKVETGNFHEMTPEVKDA